MTCLRARGFYKASLAYVQDMLFSRTASTLTSSVRARAYTFGYGRIAQRLVFRAVGAALVLGRSRANDVGRALLARSIHW